MATPFQHTWDETPDTVEHRITVSADRMTVEILAAVLHRVSTSATAVTGTRTMATYPRTTLELTVRLAGNPEQAETALRASLHELARPGVDIAVLRADRAYGLVVFDADNTLVRGEAIDRLAARTGHQPEVSALTERAMRGDLDFAEALRARASLLRGLPVSVLDEIAADLELMPGALTAIRVLQSHDVRVGVVSGGFARIIEPLAASLRLDFCVANDLAAVDGVLTGELSGHVVDRAAKSRALREYAARYRVPLEACAAVGDGANDIDMLRCAGLGVAFTDRAQVVAAADVAISPPRLDLVLPMLGIPVPCAVVSTCPPPPN